MTWVGLAGANLWIVAVAVPLALGHHALSGAPAGAILGVAGLALFAPALLLVGMLRRSSGLLLAAFPASTLLWGALVGGGASARIIPEPPLLLGALSLLAYLGLAAHALRQGELSEVAPPDFVRTLAAAPIEPRWRRRIRIYRGLAILAALFPLVLIWDIGMRASTARALAATFGERMASAQALLCAAAGLLSLVVFRGYLLAPLQGHLQQDREVLASLEDARKQARRGRPRPAFYLFVALALGAMAAVVWQRSHS